MARISPQESGICFHPLQHSRLLCSGTKFLMQLLASVGRADLALVLSENVDYPSWFAVLFVFLFCLHGVDCVVIRGWMVANPMETPGTTIWELWDAPNEGVFVCLRSGCLCIELCDW